jgi:DNA polymerase-3 subunit epsilon/ATP-dependent DNA helicase DinG
MVSHITGIKDADLTDAPLFKDIQAKLVEFIGPHPIIGHNIGFDISFLNQKGPRLDNPLYDTLQLATILLPGLASYSLDTLSRILKNHTYTKAPGLLRRERLLSAFPDSSG